jgi:hypothetical protein
MRKDLEVTGAFREETRKQQGQSFQHQKEDTSDPPSLWGWLGWVLGLHSLEASSSDNLHPIFRCGPSTCPLPLSLAPPFLNGPVVQW